MKNEEKICDCGTILALKVLKSAAGYYLGYCCPSCGPYDRISAYYGKEEAESLLGEIKSDDRDPIMKLIRCRQCGSKVDSNLYVEGIYHDVSCMECGHRSGKYGDENKAINLWNGIGIRFYAVMWHGSMPGMILEIWDDEETANERSKFFMDMIHNGQSVLGYKLDLTRGYREYTTVKPIEPNIKYVVEVVEHI